MCLQINKKSITKTEKVKENGDFIIAYKVLKNDGKSPYQKRTYRNGLNISNRRLLWLTRTEVAVGRVYKGFHCFTNLTAARDERLDFGAATIYKAKIAAKDLIAIGTFDGHGSLVCKKLTIDLTKPVT